MNHAAPFCSYHHMHDNVESDCIFYIFSLGGFEAIDKSLELYLLMDSDLVRDSPSITTPSCDGKKKKKKSRHTIVRMMFLVVFLGWLMVWVLLPTKMYKQKWTPKLNSWLNSTYFGEQGWFQPTLFYVALTNLTSGIFFPFFLLMQHQWHHIPQEQIFCSSHSL